MSKRIVCALIIFFSSVSVLFGQSFYVNDIKYTIISSIDHTVSVNSYYKYKELSSIVIPDSIIYNGRYYSVTSIGDNAFDGCNKLISVVIPSTVTTIGNLAFAHCVSLTSVEIPLGVTSIGSSAFYYSGLKSIEIPFCVKTIGKRAFGGCSSLDTIRLNTNKFINVDVVNNPINVNDLFDEEQKYVVVIGDSVETIVRKMFSDCVGLTSIIIPSSVTSIGSSAFSNCTSLKSIIIPSSVTSIGGIIGSSVFYNCTSLTSVVIPNSVTCIASGSFSNCTSLASVDIPSSVTSIESNAFSGCSSLKSVSIPYGVVRIRDNAFKKCTNLTSVDIPCSVTEISQYSFVGCSNLDTLYWNSNVAISDCFLDEDKAHLKHILLGDSIKSIRNYFFNCTGITEVDIPLYLTSIDDGAFCCCTNLRSIQIPSNITSIGDDAFDYCTSLTSIEIPSSVTSIGNSAFSGCSSITSIDIPSSVKSIGDYAFYRCSNLTSVEIKPGVTSIGNCMFTECNSLTTIVIPSSVISIGYNAFSGCSSLTSINIPSGVETIEAKTFYDCTSLTSIVIPSSIKYIGDCAFSGCSNLTSIDIPYSVVGLAVSAFSDCSSLDTLFWNSDKSPRDALKALKEHLTTLYLGDSIHTINSYAFSECNKLKKIIITAKKPPIIYFDSFCLESYRNCKLYVPQYCDSLYMNSVYWDRFGDVRIYDPDELYNYLDFTIDNVLYGKHRLQSGDTILNSFYPYLEGHTFNAIDSVPVIMPRHDVSIRGGFSVNEYTLSYLIGDSEYINEVVKYGTNITPISGPDSIGYTFLCWYDIPGIMPARDIEVKGLYNINDYALTYLVDGVLFKVDTLTYKSDIFVEPTPMKDGYTFSGWSEIPTNMPAHDVEIMGSFSINSYILTYIVDGVEYKKDTVAYSTVITPLEALTREGYTFSGWSDIPSTMPSHDVEIVGSFSINSYVLTYRVNGEEYKKDTLAYNTDITPLAVLVKEGYTFSGWNEIPTTMPAHDVEITGYFSINSYILTYKVDGVEYNKDTIEYNSTIMPLATPTKKGYTFSGWSEIPTNMSANDVEVVGTFMINSYILIYNVDGVEYKRDTIAYNTVITPLAALTKKGYTFSGWSDIPATMPAHDVEITGSFCINSYILSYIVDGVEYKKDTVVYNTRITPLKALTKEGYTFSGWSEIPITMPSHDVEISGSFSITSYFLTYRVNGEEYKKDTLVYNTVILPLAALEQEGYTFSGWSEIPATMPARDVEVAGSFSINSYILQYMVDGVEYDKDTIDYNSTIMPLTTPTKKGYTFSGWSEIPTNMPAHDVVITGSFCINSYILSYRVDGVEYKKDTVAYKTRITPLETLIKEGYTFSGWSENPAFMPANDVEIIGSFSINSYKLTYKVDGLDYKIDSITYASVITADATPTKEGYTFSGWSEIPTTMPSHDVEITGSFSINSYILSYRVNGEEYKKDTLVYNTDIISLAALEKDGYTFSGWSEIPTTMPAHDVEVVGIFTINSYILTYMIDDMVYKTDTLAYNTEIIAESVPTIDGYTFSGWSAIPSTMPSYDLTIVGYYVANKYAVVYMPDGEEYKADSISYGDSIVLIDNPIKDDYEFLGWTGYPDDLIMPAHDIVISGEFMFSAVESIRINAGPLIIFDLLGNKIDVDNLEQLPAGIYILNGRNKFIKR